MKRNKNKGFSLVELMLVLSVLMALAIAAFVIYEKVRTQLLAQTTVSNTEMISQNLFQIFQGNINSIKQNQYNDTDSSTTSLINIMKTFIKNDSGLKLSTTGVYMYKDKNGVYYNPQFTSYNIVSSNTWKGLTIDIYFKDTSDCVATLNKFLMSPEGASVIDFDGNMYVTGKIANYKNNYLNYNVIKADPSYSYTICDENEGNSGFALAYKF